MLNMISKLKLDYKALGAITKLIIKISLIVVFTCFFASIFCYLIKDFTNMYAFFYTTAEELLIVTRTCTVLGLAFSLIAFYIEKR